MTTITASADTLPEVIPIFPLAGVLLLPRGRLPLNIFEPRYLTMTADVMEGNGLIGMIQPRRPEDEGAIEPPVYGTGCAGRIDSFKESDDGRYLITLAGVCRFDVVEELDLDRAGYRRVRVDFRRYLGDLTETAGVVIDRARLVAALRTCFPQDGEGSIEWPMIERMPAEALVTALAMMFPFQPSEKQALLECATVGERAELLTTLMEMSALERDGEEMLVQ